MSLEEFKSTWASDLADLSTTRITTLWKKSKTQSRDEISAAIAASKSAAAKDHARRGKVAPAQTASPSLTESDESPSQDDKAASVVAEPEVAPVLVPEPEVVPVLVPDQVVAEPEVVPVLVPDPVESEVNRRWSGICAPLGIDQHLLTGAVRKLYQWIMHKDIADNDRAARIVELYECVDRLMTMRHKYGESVNVLKALGFSQP